MKRIFWEKDEKIELEKSFSQNPHPDMATRQLLADKFRVTVEKITNFFKNKRQKLRRDGHPIKRVFRQEKSKKSARETDDLSRNSITTKTTSTPLEEPEDEIFVVKIETIESESVPEPESIETSNPTRTLEQCPAVVRFAKARVPEINKINSDEMIRKIPKMGIIAKISNSSSQNDWTATQRGPIQSLFPATPVLNHQQVPTTPLIPTYLPIQTPYIPSCLDFTAGQYFPINYKQSVATYQQPIVENGENLDDIFDNNLKQLNESEDTGIETDSFECLSEKEKEIEIKPLPNWFPFSALYPNQPIYPKTNPFLTF